MLFRSLAFDVLLTAEAVSQMVPSLRGATPEAIHRPSRSHLVLARHCEA